jgi:hypothetical protein
MAFVMAGVMRIIVGIIAHHLPHHRTSSPATSGRTGRVVAA